MCRLAVYAAALGALVVGPTFAAEANLPSARRGPEASTLARGAAGGDRQQRLTLGADIALYDQWASESLTGSSGLGTIAWQLDGGLRLIDLARSGKGSIGWSFLGSRSIGSGAPNDAMSELVGSISALNANAVPNAVAVDELYWRHASGNGRWTLLAGRVDQASYFDANRVANSAYGQFFAFAFENNLSVPWSTYGSFGGLLRFELGTGRYLLASVAAAGNEDPRIPWSDSGHDGWNQLLELGTTHSLPGLGRGHIRLTPWHSRIPGASGFGIALNLDQELAMRPRRTERIGPDRPTPGRLVGFFRGGVGDPAVTPVQAFISGGVALNGPFGRAGDAAALGVAWSRPSPGAGQRSEGLIEAYYRFTLSRALSLTPDVQIVIDPANNPDARHVVVLGARLHLQF